MKTRLRNVFFTLVLILILNLTLTCFVPRVAASQMVLTKIGQIETSDAYDLWIDTDLDIAFVTCGYSGVKVFDVSDPTNITEIANVPSSLSGYAHQLVKYGNLVYVGDGQGGLKIIRFDDLLHPVVLSQYTNDYTWDVEVLGNTAFLANGFMGSGDRLTVVNVTDPAAPVPIGSHVTAGDATDIEVVGSYAFLTTSYAGFTVFDINNRTNPMQVGHYEDQSAGNAEVGDLEVVESLAFLSYWGKSFKVLNVSDFSKIEVLSEFNESLSTFSVHIDSDRGLAFLCDQELGLLLLDIKNPEQLSEVARYFDGGKPCRIDMAGDLIYMTDQDNGFVILRIREGILPTMNMEPVILIGGLAVILVLSWWLKKSRMSGHSTEGI